MPIRHLSNFIFVLLFVVAVNAAETGNNNDAVRKLPIGIIIADASDVQFFNSVARPDDIIAAKPDAINLLDSVKTGRKMLFIGPRHEGGAEKWAAMSDDAITSLIVQAKRHGAAMLAYNLENHFKVPELLERERHVAQLAHANGLSYVFGPLAGRLMSPGGEALAKEADQIVVQAQAFQRSSFQSGIVLQTIQRLRAANPKAVVQVQISFLNRENNTFLTADEVLRHAAMLAGHADMLWLFSGPRTTSLQREVYTRLRKSESGVQSAATPAPKPTQPGLKNPGFRPRPGTMRNNFQPGSRNPGVGVNPMQQVPRNIRFATGSWVPFARLGGQVGGDCSPQLARILDEAGTNEAQRRAIESAYKSGANAAVWKTMSVQLGKDQLERIGRRNQRTSPTRHALVFAIEAQTASHYPDAAKRIFAMVDAINAHFAAGGVMDRFHVAGVKTYDKTKDTGVRQPQNSGGKSLPADYETHGHNQILVALDEGASGANWPCPWVSSIEVHGGRDQYSGPKQMFNQRSSLILCHELGHMLGLPDFYALRIQAEDNPITHEAVPSDSYDPFGGSLMDDLGPFHQWDVEIINREIPTLPVINHTWIDYQPLDCVLRLVDKNGNPLQGADVKGYRSNRTNYYRQSIDKNPTYSGKTDAAGRISLGPNVLGVDPYEALRFFLIEIRQADRVDYRWISFIDVNFSFWRNEEIAVGTRL